MHVFPIPAKDKERDHIRLVDVVSLVHRIDEEDIEVVLAIYNFVRGKFVKKTINRAEITPRKIQDIIDRNGGVCRNAKQTYRYIQDKVAKLLIKGAASTNTQVVLKHSTLGWHEYDCRLTFNASEIYTKYDVIPSEYCGTYKIQAVGSLGNIRDLYNDCLQDNIPMLAVSCMASAATVLPFANRLWSVTIYNPINHLMGDSTTGKSTAAVLFTSFGGSPVGIDGFMLSFLGTSNAIVKMIGENHGYPCAIDEFSTAMSRSDWTDFIYTLANGRGKTRCQAGGTKTQKVEQFETVFLTNGEMSILNKCSKNEGIRARLFEYQIESWTRSAEEADMIKAVAKANYGLLTPLIAQELLISGSNWFDRFKSWNTVVKTRIHTEDLLLGIGDRIADYVTLYMVSAEILSHVLGVSLPIDEIFEFFFLHIIFKNAEDANLGLRAYEAIVDYFSKNRERYPAFVEFEEDEGIVLNDEQEGVVIESRRKHMVGETAYHDYVIFDIEILEGVLARRGFADPKIALKAVHKEKLLRTKDKNRIYLERRVNGVIKRVYAVWMQLDW